MFQYLNRFFYILSERKKQLLFLTFLVLFTSVLETFGIGLIGPFISLATNQQLIQTNTLSNWIYRSFGFQSNVQFMSVLGLIIVAILYFKSFLSFNVQKYIFEFGFGQQAELRVRLAHTYLIAPYTFHLNHNSADLIENILMEAERFSTRVLMPILFCFSNGVVVLFLLGLLYKTDSIATVVIVFAILILACFLYPFKDKLLRWGRDGTDADVEMIRSINHAIGGIKEIKVIGCEHYFMEEIIKHADRSKKSASLVNTFSLLPRFLLEPLLVTFLVGFTILYLATSKSAEGLAAMLGVFAVASIRLLPAVSAIMQALGGLRSATYTVDRIFLELKEAKLDSGIVSVVSKGGLIESAQDTFKFQREISLKEVTYQYPSSLKPSLNNLSINVEKGQSIGLVGKSGAGKTTLADILLGLLEPNNGSIVVDGVSINKNNIRSWQNLIGYIPQSIFLIDDTIERNIAFGVPDEQIDSSRLNKAICTAQLTELIDQLPMGIKTQVGERGVCLSGGQRQRVGIARALYHEREILVLDEATAALDNETESLVAESIKLLSGKKTIIIIAHRLSTIEHCDCVYLLDKGQVVNWGTYQDVVTTRMYGG